MMRYFIFILGITLFFTACEKDIELDLTGQKKLVVLSNFAPDSLFRIYLSTNIVSGSTASPKYPSDASIQLFEGGNYIQDLTFYDEDPSILPYYTFNRSPKINTVYSIKASFEDYPDVEASDIIPAPVRLSKSAPTNITLREDDNNPRLYEYRIKTRLKISSQSDEPQFFHLKARKDLISYYLNNTDTVKHIYPQEMPFRFPPNIPHLKILHEDGVLFSDKAFRENPDGIELVFTFEHDALFELKAPIYLELRTVSEDYYLFHRTVGEQEVSRVRQSILSESSVSIHNNIRGGIGNFSGYSVTLDSIIW